MTDARRGVGIVSGKISKSGITKITSIIEKVIIQVVKRILKKMPESFLSIYQLILV